MKWNAAGAMARSARSPRASRQTPLCPLPRQAWLESPPRCPRSPDPRAAAPASEQHPTGGPSCGIRAACYQDRGALQVQASHAASIQQLLCDPQQFLLAALNRIVGIVEHSVGVLIVRLARVENGHEIGHGRTVVCHGAEIALLHDAAHMVL